MDASLQTLAARWVETRDPAHEAAFLEALQQAGRLRRSSVEAAAWLGDKVARKLLGPRADRFRPAPQLSSFLDLLPGDEGVQGQAALTVLGLLAQVPAAQEHAVGKKVLRALDCEGQPTVERLLTARAAARRTVETLWKDMVSLAHDCLDDAVIPQLSAALQTRLLPWVFVRPDPGGAPLEELPKLHPLFSEHMTVEAARAVLNVPASYPYDSAPAKELIQDYLLALGWKRDIGAVNSPDKRLRLKFDMTARKLLLSESSDGQWVAAWSPAPTLSEVATRLVLEAEDALRAAGEQPPIKRLGGVRRRKKGDNRKSAWTEGGPPTLKQLDQIAELQRGMSDAAVLEILREAAGVESVGDLRKDTAGAVILKLSGF